MREAALCFPIRDRHVLMAERVEGTHAGRYSGYGGGIERRESTKKALIRELEEESGISADAGDLFDSAIVVTYRGGISQHKLHIYTMWKWHGEPRDTSEMRNARWFPFHQLPYERMFPADRLWMPKVLAGERFVAHAHLDKEGPRCGVISYKMTPRYHPYKGPAE